MVGESSIESSSELNSINGLSNSESHWNLISGESQTGHSIRELSGLLNLAHGSFDPLADEFPTIPLSYVNYNDYDVTGMKYIQFHDYDYQLITELEEARSFDSSGYTWRRELHCENFTNPYKYT